MKGFFAQFLIIAMAVILGLVFIAFIFNGQPILTSSGGSSVPTRSNSLIGFLSNSASNPNKNTPVVSSNPSNYRITISSGNASSEIQPFREYVIIKNTGGTAVNITGWKVKNSKGDRPIQNSQNSYVYPTAEYLTIPQGAKYLSPSGAFTLSDIILGPGEQAYLVTGGPFVQYRFPIPVSFKENICTGYLNSDVYPFNPSLQKNCPYLRNEIDLSTVTKQCGTYIESLSRCEDPEKQDKANLELQPTLCQNAVKVRANYGACAIIHQNDAKFYTKNWRVFLGRQREMWAKGEDTITLIDRQGNTIAEKSY
jgi:hypothetical protein